MKNYQLDRWEISICRTCTGRAVGPTSTLVIMNAELPGQFRQKRWLFLDALPLSLHVGVLLKQLLNLGRVLSTEQHDRQHDKHQQEMRNPEPLNNRREIISPYRAVQMIQHIFLRLFNLAQHNRLIHQWYLLFIFRKKYLFSENEPLSPWEHWQLDCSTQPPHTHEPPETSISALLLGLPASSSLYPRKSSTIWIIKKEYWIKHKKTRFSIYLFYFAWTKSNK